MKKNSFYYLILFTTISLFWFGFEDHPESVNNLQKKKEPVVLMKTDFGKIKVKLYNETPKHRDNFLKLVKKGYYDSTLFHRVIEKFMIQGGDPESKNAKKGEKLGEGNPGYKLDAEIKKGLIHKRGALAAARKPDHKNPKRKSSGSQFYIVQGRKFTKESLEKLAKNKENSARKEKIQALLKKDEYSEERKKINEYRKKRKQKKINALIGKMDSIVRKKFSDEIEYSFTDKQIETYTTVGGAPHLDGAYTVFGEVIEGMDVVDRIAAVEKDERNRPVDDIRVQMEVLKE